MASVGSRKQRPAVASAMVMYGVSTVVTPMTPTLTSSGAVPMVKTS